MRNSEDFIQDQERISEAVNVARMYYYQGMKTEIIAKEMHVSRSTISRLLDFARLNGLVEIRVIDPNERPQVLERKFLEKFGIKRVHVVSVPELAGESAWLERVAQYTAIHLNTLFGPEMVLGIAWGTTLTAISKHLLKKRTFHSHVIQLNGAGNIRTTGLDYSGEIISRFAYNYSARSHLFPVPTYFDNPETKQWLWKEGSIRHILELQEKADYLLYSIGAVNAGVPSHVHSAGYLNKNDYRELEKLNVAGDIATVFYREDGSFDDIPINQRASGPSLDFFQKKYGICVVSGLAKITGLHGALKGKFLKELIIDEPTARKFAEKYFYELSK
jgi:deoxyribonucleoside regulator